MTLQNPLFPQNDDSDSNPDGYVLPKGPQTRIEPLPSSQTDTQGRDAAANLIRKRIEELYSEEPGAKEELKEIATEQHKLSRHQQYLKDLQDSAKSVAEVQVKWHEYYAALPEEEKHEVWQEFYAEQAKHSRYAQFATKQPKVERPSDPQEVSMRSGNAPKKAVVSNHDIATPSASAKRVRDMRSTREIKNTVATKASAGGKLKTKHHFQSLFFGLGMGALVLVIMLFGLFNELIVAPFIQPSRNVSATPIILPTDGIAYTNESKVIIPKINVEIPIDFSLTSLSEDVVQAGLEGGVIHYPVTSMPGEKGNGAYFGHSSNNIFNPGKYKFAFVLLNKLENGDMFYVTHQGKAYAYKVFKKQIVNPDDTWVLGPVPDKPVTATLITCDPPGTTRHRLVVWGEQISPDPATATDATAPPSVSTDNSSDELPGAPPSAWQRFKNWIF